MPKIENEPRTYDLANEIVSALAEKTGIEEVLSNGPRSSVVTVYYPDGTAFEILVRRAV